MQTNTTLSEVAQARPKRGAGAPARSRSHYAAILQLLRERGPQGVLGSELYSHPEMYGRSPRNRISELRRDGHLIEGKAHGSSDWFYRLIRENHSPDRLRQAPARVPKSQLRKDDPSVTLTLFDLTVQP
jgi:hypothetical protein